MAASLAFRTLLSMSPFLIIITYLSTLLLDSERVKSIIFSYTSGVFGEDSARLLENIIQNSLESQSSNLLAVIIAFGLAFFSSLTLMAELKHSLNQIFGVEYGKEGVKSVLRDKLFSLFIGLSLGLTLIFSFLLSSASSLIKTLFINLFGTNPALIELFNFIFTFSLLSLLLSIIFSITGYKKINLNLSVIGGIVAAFSLTLGKTIIAWYLSHSVSSSIYGPAAIVILILMWVYLSSQIIFYIAEFISVISMENNSYLNFK
jgi:membrane protein